MAERNQSGIGGTKPRPQLDALGKFRMAVMPNTKSKSLSEILEEMPDKERRRRGSKTFQRETGYE